VERPLIVRPGGMGDLILLCIACEELGIDLQQPLWLIEQRSRAWAEHLGLDYLCYDSAPLETHWRIAGRFRRVINSEQRFGLSQATALLARRTGGRLVCFDTNRAAGWADERVSYDRDVAHEVGEFSRLVGGHRCRLERTRKHPVAGRPVAGIGGMQSPARAFSADQWEAFLKTWAADDRFYLAGAEPDRAFILELARRFDGQAEPFLHSFRELCHAIARSPRVFTVDSGFAHIASYYAIPSTVIFTSGRDAKWAAIAPGSVIVRRKDLSCQPCTWFGQVPECTNNYACKEVRLEDRLVSIA
jgi:hypothetical protein